MNTVTPEQLIAARHLLGWIQRDLAAKINLDSTTWCTHERGRKITPERMKKVIEVFQQEGIEFINELGRQGVVLKNGSNGNGY